MFEVRKIKRADSIAPNIIGVVNSSFPKNKIPTRGYVLNKENKNIDILYGGLEKAIECFVNRVEQIPKVNEIYIIGFISGRIIYDEDKEITKKEQDFFIYPFRHSKNTKNRTKTKPFIIKDGTVQPWEMEEGDDHHIILGDEAIHRRTRSFKKYITTFPRLTGLEYID